MSGPLLRVTGVWREYSSGDEAIAALCDVDLEIEAGDMVAIIGQSGSGKSTLMNILGCLDQPTSGDYRIDGVPVSDFDGDELAGLRRRTF
ncbi:MAG TPA: ATP-binding cassette domain-containing protein, partial [Caulobacteraceae bacterium]|nr:ATP-binding cassette domain-containing protein [Caulobacteraceae bacterium]